MAAYSTVKYGSKGSDVIALQNALNSAGYNLTVDGIFGNDTLNAVKQYQKSNGLTVDGIVGNNTWSVLNGASSASSSPAPGTGQSVAATSLLTNTTDPNTGLPGTAAQQLEMLLKMKTGWEYTPKTEEQIRTQAEGEYQAYYDQLRRAAQMQQESQDLALAQQREGLQRTYDKQRDRSAAQYQQAYSQTDRQLLSRGMQRSSYGAGTLTGVLMQGAQAQQDISDAQAEAEGNIDQQRELLAGQLAAQLAGYDADQAKDILARVRQLQDTEYDRQVDAWKSQSELEQQIYQFLYQRERDAAADAQWERQFAENQRQFDASLAAKSRGGGGGGGRSSSSAAAAETPTGTPTATGVSFDSFVSMLGGSAGGSDAADRASKNAAHAALSSGKNVSASVSSAKSTYTPTYLARNANSTRAVGYTQ